MFLQRTFKRMIDLLLRVPPLLFYSVMSLAFLAIIAKAGEYIVYGISDYARKLGISDYLIGLVVISIGTATSELVAAITGAFMGESAIVFGTVLGSSLAKLPILGICFIAAKKIKIKKTFRERTPALILAIAALPLMLIIDGNLSRIDGMILIGAFVFYLSQLWKNEGKLGKIKRDVSFRKLWRSGLIFSIALAALLYSARWLVFSCLQISKILDIPVFIVGLIILGIGSSLPELTVQLKSILKNHPDIAVGNAFGSIVANSALVLGIVGLIGTITVQPITLALTAISLIMGLIYMIHLITKGEADWKHGIILILFYVIVIAASFIF